MRKTSKTLSRVPEAGQPDGKDSSDFRPSHSAPGCPEPLRSVSGRVVEVAQCLLFPKVEHNGVEIGPLGTSNTYAKF